MTATASSTVSVVATTATAVAIAVAMQQAVQRGTRDIIRCSKVATGDRRNVFLNKTTIKLR